MTAEESDLEPVLRVMPIALPLQSCDCDLGTWKPARIYCIIIAAFVSHVITISELPS